MAECIEEPEGHTLKIEAEEVVKEVAFAVNFVDVSKVLPSSNVLVYLNLCTKETDNFCVELSVQGFRVVGREHDSVDTSMVCRHYETIYSLLDAVSPGYRNSFSETLTARLRSLAQPDEQDEESMDTK